MAGIHNEFCGFASAAHGHNSVSGDDDDDDADGNDGEEDENGTSEGGVFHYMIMERTEQPTMF